MALNKYYLTANVLIDDVAIDFGLEEVADPVASTDKDYKRLRRQLSIAVEELAEVHKWEQFKRSASLTTAVATNADGEYDLPTDFHYMIPQTHWDTTNDVPLGGPLSSQDWTYLLGRDLVSSTIYASFRQQEGVLALWPAPPADGLVITYEYASRNWIRNAADDDFIQRIENGGDTILFPPSLIRSYLMSKFRGSKGFDTMTAQDAIALFFDTASSKEAGAPVLNMTNKKLRYPYLEARRNLPDTGYGT